MKKKAKQTKKEKRAQRALGATPTHPVDLMMLEDIRQRCGPEAARELWADTLEVEERQRRLGWWWLGGPTGAPVRLARVPMALIARDVLDGAERNLVRLLPGGRVDSDSHLTVEGLHEAVLRAKEDEQVALLPEQDRSLVRAMYEARRRGLVAHDGPPDAPIRVINRDAFPEGAETSIAHVIDYMERQDRGEVMS